MTGRRAASYRPGLIVIGISGHAGWGLFRPDLLRLLEGTELGEAGRRPAREFDGLGRLAGPALRAPERRQGGGLPAPVTAAPVAGQRLAQAVERLRVPAQRQVRTTQH